MKAIKGLAQIGLALVCLAAALVFCVCLAVGRLAAEAWELVDAFFREAFNTEFCDFFKGGKR